MVISEPDVNKLADPSINILTVMEKWFMGNKLTLNLNKINFIKFASNKKAITDMQISYNDQYIQKTTKFLGLHTESRLKWKNLYSTHFSEIKHNMFRDNVPCICT
jgi:hypothetical protein